MGKIDLVDWKPKASSGCGSKSVGVEAFPVKGQGDGNAVVRRSGGVGDLALLFEYSDIWTFDILDVRAVRYPT